MVKKLAFKNYKSSTFTRLLSGSTARGVLLFCNIVTSFIMLPFLIHHLGDRMYGFWCIIGTVVGYFGYFDFGLSSAVSRFVSRAIGKSDENEVNLIISNSLILFSLFGIIVCIMSFLIAIFGQYLLESTERVLFRDCILIMGVTLAISFPVRALTGVLFAKLQHSLFAISEIIGVLFKFTLIMYFIKKGFGIRTIAIVSAIGQIISCIITVAFFLKTQNFKLCHYSKKCIKELFSYAIFTFAAQLAEIIRLRLSPLIITSFLGFRYVTLYNIADRLVDYFRQIIFNLLGTLTPVFSKLEGQNNFNEIEKKFKFLSKISAFITLYIGCGMMIFCKPFIMIWVGEQYLDAYKFLQVLIISYTITLMNTTAAQLMYGISKHKYVAAISWIEAITNLILCIVLVRHLGLFGIALGVSIPMAFLKGIVQPVVICRIIKISIMQYYFKIIGPIIFTAVSYSFLFWYFSKSFLLTSYMKIVIMSALFSGGFILVLVTVNFWKDTFTIVKKYYENFMATQLKKKMQDSTGDL